MSCVIDIGLNGIAQDAIGLPTRLEAYARVQGQCTRVRFAVRQAAGLPVLFTGETDTDSNGTALIEFPLEPAAFPCGFRFWVRAECATGGTCFKEGLVAVSCKRPAPGGNVPGDNDGDGQPDSNQGWPWPLPPQLFCPLMGRAFTMALLAGLMFMMFAVATNIPNGVMAAGVLIAGAFALLGIWRMWCAMNPCHFWGAVLWVLKRVVVAGVILAAVTPSLDAGLFTLALGMLAGAITARQRANRCTLPGLTTPLQQLPLW